MDTECLDMFDKTKQKQKLKNLHSWDYGRSLESAALGKRAPELVCLTYSPGGVSGLSSGCCMNITHAGESLNRHSSPHSPGGGSPGVGLLQGAVPGEDSLPGWQMAACLLCPCTVRGASSHRSSRLIRAPVLSDQGCILMPSLNLSDLIESSVSTIVIRRG